MLHTSLYLPFKVFVNDLTIALVWTVCDGHSSGSPVSHLQLEQPDSSNVCNLLQDQPGRPAVLSHDFFFKVYLV